MPKIHVDEQVMAELKRRAGGRTHNDLIRQLLGLSAEEPQTAEPAVYLIPHGAREFDDFIDLSRWLREDLMKRINGEYLVASSYYWRNVVPDSVCYFHKNKKIVGEGRLSGGLEPYNGPEISPQTNRRYAGVVHFDPTSIDVYKNPILFSQVEKLLGKTLTFRGVQRLTLKDYNKIRPFTTLFPSSP